MSYNPKELECGKCKRKWTYKGTNKVKATCPDCHKLVEIQKVILE